MRAVPILAYHRVAPLDGTAGDAFTVAPDVFAHQMDLIRRRGRIAIGLEELVASQFPAESRPVVLTFDDGFASNREFAWPILAKSAARATTFIVTGQLGGRNEWDASSIPRYPLLSAEDCTTRAAPMISFQSHGVTHRRLPGLDATSLARELSESRRALAELTARSVDLFCYPFGSVTATVAHAVRVAGYRAACTCYEGLTSADTNPFLLRRATVSNDDVDERFVALVETASKPSSVVQSLRARVREASIRIGFAAIELRDRINVGPR